MSVRNRLYQDHITLDEEQASQLSYSNRTWYNVEVRPPKNGDIPATLREFAAGIRELQTKWLKLRNASPVIAFEIRRHTPDKLQFQFSTPTKRLERKIRTQLSNQVPGVEFGDGLEGLPAGEDRPQAADSLPLGEGIGIHSGRTSIVRRLTRWSPPSIATRCRTRASSSRSCSSRS